MSFLPTGKCVVDCSQDPGRTKQKVGVEHDINKIIARYKRSGGQLPVLQDAQGQFVDVSQVGDYQECLQRIEDARRLFMQYPPEIRRRFGNDVDVFSSFVSSLSTDKDAFAEAVKLGMVKAPEVPVEPAPQKVIIVDGQKPDSK